MYANTYNLFLADDDTDDCLFFREALKELPFASTLETAKDGTELMRVLETKKENLPDILFLDLNMPRKTGYQCLSEIRNNSDLKKMPVIIISTSLDPETANSLYEKGANYYVCKPGDFYALKKLIQKTIDLVEITGEKQPPRESFIVSEM